MKIGIREDKIVIVPTQAMIAGREYTVPLEVIKEIIAKENKNKTK